MNNKIKAIYQAQAQILKALAHPTRLLIVDELSRNEQCVNSLTEMIGADASTVSKHLSILKNAGIITDEKRGSQVFYKLKMKCVLGFFSCVNTVLEETAKERIALTADSSSNKEI